MSIQLQTLEAPQTDVRPQTPSLTQVLSVIAVDAAAAPEAYLRETEVPHGGE